MWVVQVARDGVYQDWAGGQAPQAAGLSHRQDPLPPSGSPARCRCPASSCARVRQPATPARRGYWWGPPLPLPQTSTGHSAGARVCGPISPPHLARAGTAAAHAPAVPTRSALPPPWGALAPSAPAAAMPSSPGPPIGPALALVAPPGPVPVGSDAPGRVGARGPICATP